MSPIMLAGLLATLASGFIALFLLASRPQIRGLNHFSALIANMLLFNLLAILGLVWQIFNSAAGMRSPDQPESPAAKGIAIAVLLVLGLLKIGWIYSLQLLALKLLAQPRPAGLKAVAGAAGGLLFVMSGAGWISSFGQARHAFVFTAFSVFEMIVLAAVIATAVVIIEGARRSEDIRARKAVSAFGWIYLALFSCVLIFLVAPGGQAGRSGETFAVINALGLLLFNPALYFWARKSAGVFAQNQPDIRNRTDLIAEYGISGREGEIIALICRGKTNQEIADELCISAQTVKDHNYNIFQKTGVKNRTQLAHLFMKKAGD